MAPTPLTAAELKSHPAYDRAVIHLEPTTKGKVAVAARRGGPLDIAYEIHGSGPVHLVWVMGLGSLMRGWAQQTREFGHNQASKYSSLIFDNRGMGDSDKPIGRYSTSEMAKDAFELLDHLGWTSDRQLHVIGISMGGMIAQEMAYLQPKRIASLSLVSTAARLVNTVGFVENLRTRINMFIPKQIDIQLAEIKARLLGQEWVEAPDQDGDFSTNGDRFAALEIRKRDDTERFTRKGFMCQAVAAGWHHKSAEQLEELADAVGRDRILVMHGTVDNMITPSHGETLVKELGGEESGLTTVVMEGKGHVLPVEARTEVNKLLGALFEKTEGLAK